MIEKESFDIAKAMIKGAVGTAWIAYLQGWALIPTTWFFGLFTGAAVLSIPRLAGIAVVGAAVGGILMLMSIRLRHAMADSKIRELMAKHNAQKSGQRTT